MTGAALPAAITLQREPRGSASPAIDSASRRGLTTRASAAAGSAARSPARKIASSSARASVTPPRVRPPLRRPLRRGGNQPDLDAPVHRLALGRVVLRDGLRVGERDRRHARRRYAALGQDAHHTRRPRAGQLPVGRIALGEAAADRHVVRVPLHQDAVRQLEQAVRDLAEHLRALGPDLRRAGREQHALGELHVEAVAQLLDLDAARRDLALEVGNETVVGAAELLHLGGALRELARGELQVLLELVSRGAQLLDAGGELLALGGEILDLRDQLHAFVREALVRGLEQPHALLERIALGRDAAVLSARHAAERKPGESRQRELSAVRAPGCGRALHRCAQRTGTRGPSRDARGSLRRRAGSAPAAPRAGCRPASRRAPSP